METRLQLFILVLFFSMSLTSAASDCNSANLNGVGYVDCADLALLAADWLHMNEPNLLGDINKDGNVEYEDLESLTRYWLTSCQGCNLITKGTLTRNSIAYLDGVEYPPNIPRYKTYAVCGPSDLIIHSTVTVQGVGDICLVPFCIAGGYLYASEPTPNGMRGIFRTTDGVVWNQVVDRILIVRIAKIYAVRDGSILISKCDDDGVFKLYKSSDGGVTLSEPKIVFDLGSPSWWSYHQAKNGTMLIGEYRSSGGTRKIWRSVDNGDSFTMVYEEADPNVKHSHRIIKHEPSGRWLIVWGDGAIYNKVTYSDDDGITWADLEEATEQHFQPVEFLDVGDSNRILYGSDTSAFLGWYDVYTKEIDPLYTDGNWRSGAGYVFSLFSHDGVYYAGTYNSNSVEYPARRSAVLVSDDLTHWTVYHQFTNGEYGIPKIIGVLGGRIHAAITLKDSYPYYYCSFSPTNVNDINGLCIDPATTNLLSNNIRASAETDGSIYEDWNAGTGVAIELYSDDALHGSKSIKCTAANTNSGHFWPNGVSVEPETVYSCRVSVKALDYSLPSFRGRTFTTGSHRSSLYYQAAASKRRWMEIVFPVVFGVDLDVDLIFQIATNATVPYSFLLDCAQIESDHPSRWQVVGVPRAYEKFDETHNFPSTWTNLFIWSPECRAQWYTNCENQYIKTWYADQNNYIELYFNPYNRRFYLQPTINSVPQAAISTTNNYYFYRNSNVCFAVSYDNNIGLSLSVGYAGNWSHETGPGEEMMTEIIGSKTGNHAENNVMSGALLTDKLYGWSFMPSEIEKYDFGGFADDY